MYSSERAAAKRTLHKRNTQQQTRPEQNSYKTFSVKFAAAPAHTPTATIETDTVQQQKFTITLTSRRKKFYKNANDSAHFDRGVNSTLVTLINLFIMEPRLGEAPGRHVVRRRGRVRRGRGRWRRGGRRAALRRRQRRVHRRPRRLIRGRVRITTRVIERRIVGTAVQIGRVRCRRPARRRIVAGPVRGSGRRVHGPPHRIRLGPVMRRWHVRVRPAGLTRRKVSLHEQLYRPLKPFARVLRHAQYRAFTEPYLGR